MKTHIAWDHSILNNIFGKGDQQTTKTQCERRVPLSQIDNDNPTCQDCIEWLEETKRIAKDMNLDYEILF